jgi:hypothetical protein
MSKKRRIQVTIDPDLHDALKGLAEVLPGVSVSSIINDAVRPMLAQIVEMREVILAEDGARLTESFRRILGGVLTEGIHTLSGIKSPEGDKT